MWLPYVGGAKCLINAHPLNHYAKGPGYAFAANTWYEVFTHAFGQASNLDAACEMARLVFTEEDLLQPVDVFFTRPSMLVNAYLAAAYDC